MAPLIQIIIDETRKSCKKQPVACGFIPSDNAYEPLKLMQTVMAKTNEICMRYLDNSMLCSLPPPGAPGNPISVCAAKNKRRRMEDRHVVVQDLNVILNVQDASPSSYYAIFDGHAGHDAAAYSAAHLHQYLAESKHFVSNPEQALLDAFCKTDALFVEKCNVERFSSGTTAVVALHRPKERVLYVAWVGDSQALLVNQGRVLQCVHPHKPSREDEKKRIEEQGGFVIHFGTWRVNGQLAVSRAIGDSEYKPYVSAVPDIREITLDGGEDFLILACDGLWDFLSEDEAARAVYKMVCLRPDNIDPIGDRLVQLSKENGSADNISVIVVFLREPSKIAAEGARWANCTMDASLDNANNPFTNSNGATGGAADLGQRADNGLLLNLSENFKQNGGANSQLDSDFFQTTDKTTNGKNGDFDDEEDLGPETDVDAVDDVLFSPSIAAAKALAGGIVNNNPSEMSFNPFAEEADVGVEKAALEIDFDDLQKRQSDEQQRSPREETPTPPVDTVHGGIEDNLADSGEDSEDEWNYIKGEEANKENLEPSQQDLEVARILEESDNMSQLNPNAAEFVPVSPTNSVPSPACRALLMDDPVISQSPCKPSELDINLPEQEDFEVEVKSRPSEIAETTNGHGDGDGTDQKSPVPQDPMEDLLNGKCIDDIPEFQPNVTPTKVPSSSIDEFHFGPNAAPFTPSKVLDQSEMSTQAQYGDESSATLGLSMNESDFVPSGLNKESDPMSMSFYQDRGDADSFDLNKVQLIPDNLEEFLCKPDQQQQANVIETEAAMDNEERIQTTDLDKIVDDEKELASPIGDDESLIGGVCELAPSPIVPEVEENLICDLSTGTEEIVGVASSPEQIVPKVDVEVCQRMEPDVVIPTLSPEVLTPEPVSTNQDICQLSKSPEILECCLPRQSSPIELDESPVDDVTSSVKDSNSPAVQSPIPDDQILEASSPIRQDLVFDLITTTPKSLTDTESIATADVHSFIEKTQIPDVASPLSPTEELSPIAAHVETVKTENLIPEFAESTIIVTPTELIGKLEEVLVPSAPPTEEPGASPIVELAAVAEKKAPVAKSKTAASSPKKTTTGKLTASNKVPAKSPGTNKPPVTARTAAPSKTSPLKSTTTGTAAAKTTSTLRGATAPKRRLSAGGGATKVGDKKPLTNGESKPSTARRVGTTTSGSTTATKTATTTRTSTVASKVGTTRPTTAPIARSTGATSTVPPKPRPITLASRTPLNPTKSATTTKTSLTKVASPKAPTPPKPRPTTAPLAKPRVPLSSRPIPKTTAADTEKQNKESANKLTAASRTTTTRTVAATAGKTSSTVRKTESRTVTGTTRTIVSKTTTTSAKSTSGATTAAGKKPLEITRNVKTKTTKIEKPLQNGVSTVTTEQITVVNNGIVDVGEPQLLKDNSPLDNKLLVDAD